MSRTLLGGIALVAALGFTLSVPSEAHARRCCRNGGYGYSNGYSSGTYANYNSGANYSSGATTYAPGSPCAGTAPATNPDGSIAPQPYNQQAPAPSASAPPPAPAPAPAPPSTTSASRSTRVLTVRR